MENEVWKDIRGYEGLYQVSNLGRVKSLSKNVKGRNYKEIIKAPSYGGKGYYRLSLCKNGKNKYFYIHRLVAQAFISNPNNYPCVNHIDCNIYNNNFDNLEWCTYKYNNNHGKHELKRKITSLIVEIKKYDNDEKIIQILQNYYKKL